MCLSTRPVEGRDMLNIRRAQQRSLRAAYFVNRLRPDMHPRLSCRSEAEQIELFRAALDSAERFDLDRRRTLGRYLRLVARWGADLAAGPAAEWAMPLLEHPLNSAVDTVEDLERELASRLPLQDAASTVVTP